MCTQGAEATIGLGGLQQYTHLTQEDNIEDRGETLSLLHLPILISPGEMSKNAIFLLQP